MGRFIYDLCGSALESEIELPSLMHSDDKEQEADCRITIGKTPLSIDNPLDSGVCYQASQNEFLLKVRNVASYYIKNRNEIVIDPQSGADPRAIELFLTGSCFGAYFIMNGFLPLHAGGVLSSNGAILFTGVSGAGKSTTVAAMNKLKQFSIISDDICPVLFKEGSCYAVPFYKELKLWRNSLNFLGEYKDDLPRVRETMEKFYYKTGHKSSFGSYPIDRIINISSHNKDEYGIKEVEKEQEKLFLLKRQTYRRRFIKGLNQESLRFRTLATLVKRPVFELSRPNSGKSEIDSVVKAIEGIL